MDYITSNMLVPTSSRSRRNKGRLPFMDSAEHAFPNEDEKLASEVTVPENELEYNFSENIDDVDEEQVTIDLSEFLNENPLLTEPSENLADSGATLNDCHSQFRVTSSLADTTPVAIEEISSQKDSNMNESTVVTEKCSDSEVNATPCTPSISEMPPPNVLSENNLSIDSTKIPTDTVSNISPHKENILSGVKSLPNKNHKAKSTKATNLIQKYKNASRLKNFNKNNMKVFGKYPVVKCEKLDIENFIKTNSIKVGNWPIISTNNLKTKPHLNKSSNTTRKYKSVSSKVPKLLNKPISFNRCISNSQNMSTVNKARSILIDALAANSSPLIIKTDNWKPEVASMTGGSTKFITPENFQLPASQSKLPGNQRIIKLVHASSPLKINKLNSHSQKLPIITSVNKVTVGPKTFQLVSPNTFVATKPEKSRAVTPILPKPNPETISPLFLKDYTVIQPYVEDPTSPIKPKPLLTVPLDIVPVANAFSQPESINTVTEIHSPIKSTLKSAKPLQSVFLNGAINQISTPVMIGKEPLPINLTEFVHYNEGNTLPNNTYKTNDQVNTDPSIIPSKSSMIDAVTSVFSKPQIKKPPPKTKQNHSRSQRGGFSSILGCKAYNSTLNDMLFNDDFTDESYSLDDSLDISSATSPADASNKMLQSSNVNRSSRINVQESSSESSSNEKKYKGKKVFSKQKNNRKKISTSHGSDTLSASEGEEESNQSHKKISYTKRKHKKLSVNPLHNHKKPTNSLKAVSVSDESQKISTEKFVIDTSNKKKATSLNKRNKLLKKIEDNLPSEIFSESVKSSKEKCLVSNKSSSSKLSLEALCETSKSETSSLSNEAFQNDEEKLNDSFVDDPQEKLGADQESKIGVNSLRNRHKSPLKHQTAAALVKSKHKGYVHTKFKVKPKKPLNNKVTCNNKRSSRPADIIKEIKTITGGSISGKRLQKKENTLSEKANHSISSKNVSTRAKNESKTKTFSKTSKQSKRNLAVRSKTKKRIKTLKVLFKRPTHKQKSESLEMPFDDINDDALLDNENEPNSLSENNTNLNSTFRDAKSHKMGTPSKEELNCDPAVLPTELKSDDSMKENEILSNGIKDNCSIASSVCDEGESFLRGENNISTSEELKSSNISDTEQTIGDLSQKEELNAICVSSDKQETNITTSESTSISTSQPNNSDASSDFNLAMASSEDISNNVSEDAGLDLKDESRVGNSDVSVYEPPDDKINEDKITAVEEVKEHFQNLDCNNILKKDSNKIVSTHSDEQELGNNSELNTLFENNSEDKTCCDNTCEISLVSEENQSCNSDSNVVIEGSHETAQTSQEIPEPDHELDNKVARNTENKDTTENVQECGLCSDNTEVEVGDKILTPVTLADASDSEGLYHNDDMHDNGTVADDNEISPCEEVQKLDQNSVDNVMDKSISEEDDAYKGIINHNSVDNSETNKIASPRGTLQEDDQNSDVTAIQNTLDDSATCEVSSRIETPPISDIEIIPEKKKGRKPKRKLCPKMKLSVAKKADNLGPACSSKNWYVSERKESTDSTQSEGQSKEEDQGNSRRRRKTATKLSLPVSSLGKDERVCFETVAEVHAVDTDTNPSCSTVSSEINDVSDEAVSGSASSNLVKDDGSAVSSKMNKTCSVVLSELDSSQITEVKSRRTKSIHKKKSFHSSADLAVKIKEEPLDVDISATPTSEHLSSTIHVKLENEEIAKTMDEITVDTTHASSRRKGRPSLSASKKQKLDVVAAEASVEVQKKVTKKSNSMTIADSPSGQPLKLPENQGAPASSRKKRYSPEAVVIPFSSGWMRELVHRSTEGKAGKRNSDVYYFSPEGTKLRSMIEISNYLSRHPEITLTIDNFTFFKELIFREPFEIERSAKQKSVFGATSVKTETPKQTSIKKFLQSSNTPKKNNNASTGGSQKAIISVEDQNTPASSKKKTKKSISNSGGDVDSTEFNSKLHVTFNARKKAEKSANDSSGIMNTVENSDSANSRASRRVVKKVPFDNSFDDASEPRPKRGRPSKSLNTSVPEPELTKTASAVSALSDNSKSTVSKMSPIPSKTYSKSTATRNPKLKLVFSKNMNSGIPSVVSYIVATVKPRKLIGTPVGLQKSFEKKIVIPENIPKENKTMAEIFKESATIQPPCSPRCHIAAVQRPSVQCAICLCFFHPNCIPQLTDKVIFACKSCTAQKLALYEKERTFSSIPEDSPSPDDSVTIDPDIDISLLSPEVILSVQNEPITLNIPQGLSGTSSSGGVLNVYQENFNMSSPHLLSHLLKPTARLNSPRLAPLAPKPTNQNSSSSTAHMIVTKEVANKLLQAGMRINPQGNISSSTPLIVKRLPDGRRIALRATTTNSSLQNPVSNVNSPVQILSTFAEQVNGNLLPSNINLKPDQTTTNAFVKNTNSMRTSNLLTNVRTGDHFSSSKTFKFSSNLNNTSEPLSSWDMNKLMKSSKSLFLVFKRLSIPDLLSASKVCLYWNYVASQSQLWERVSFQELTITNWERCCLALQKYGTKALDLRGIVHQHIMNPWKDLESHVVHLAFIEELIFDHITPSLLKTVAYNMPLLRKLECHFVTTAFAEPEIWTVPCEWELSSLRYLGRLVKLKIGSGSRIELKNSEDYVMPYLPQLRHVALTGFNFCSNVNLESLSKQKELISLELGDCKEIEPGIYALLENLTGLKSLRLENGGNIDDCKLSEALSKIKGLEVLELMNFKISKGLSESFKELKHLIHLNVWPDNTEKGAVVNRNLFDAISSCKDLKYLCWGVIAEGEYVPQFLEMENSNELTFENLFNDLVALFPECRVEVKCAPRSSWREFCSTRK